MIHGGAAADYLIVSSTANTTGDPGTNASPAGTLDGIAGNLTIDAGGGTANRLVISDSAQTATPKSNVIQVETAIGATTYEQLLKFAGNGSPKINYIASGGGFNHITGTADGPPMHSQMSLGDTVAGLWAAHGIMMALYWRDAQGGSTPLTPQRRNRPQAPRHKLQNRPCRVSAWRTELL